MADIIINGPEGRIEARYIHNKNKKDGTPIALVLPPHPENGGTMDDQTTYAIYKALAETGFNVLRFNYRGIGNSEGEFIDDEQALSDAAYVLDWLQAHNPTAQQCWVGGFAYGSWITMQLLMRRPEIDNFIAVAPPANKADFSFLAPCPADGMILRGTADKILDRLSVAKLAKKINDQGSVKVEYYEVSGAPHNFNGKLNSMMVTIKSYVEKIKASNKSTKQDEDKEQKQDLTDIKVANQISNRTEKENSSSLEDIQNANKKAV